MRAYLFSIISERISRNLRHDFFESIINKDVAFFDERRTGDLRKFYFSNLTNFLQLVSRINSDTQVIQDCLSTNVSMFVRGSTFIICTLIILFIYSPTLAGVTLAGIVPVLAFGIVYGAQIKKLTK